MRYITRILFLILSLCTSFTFSFYILFSFPCGSLCRQTDRGYCETSSVCISTEWEIFSVGHREHWLESRMNLHSYENASNYTNVLCEARLTRKVASFLWNIHKEQIKIAVLQIRKSWKTFLQKLLINIKCS